MPTPKHHLAAINEELDVLGDLAAETDGKLTELLAGQAEIRKMLIEALRDTSEIPQLRRRIVDLEDLVHAAE